MVGVVRWFGPWVDPGHPLYPCQMGTLLHTCRGPDDKWSLEFWGQNIFDQDYAQVAFSTPFQAGTGSAPFVYPTYPNGRQLFSQFLAEPRTYGVTLRTKF